MADKVEVQFGAQLAGLTAGINQAKEQIESLASPLTSIGSAFTAFGEIAAGAFAVDRITEFVAHIAEMGAKVEEASHSLGMSAEEVSSLNVAFQAMGLDGDRATVGLERLAYNMNQAAISASGPAAHAFQALGVSMDELKHMSLDQVLDRMADEFSKTADGPNKTAVAIALLSRSGAQMIPFLDRGREGLAEFRRIAADTGTVISGSMAEGMENTDISIKTLGDAFEGVGITLFEAFKPAIDVVIQGLISLVEWFNNSIKTGGDLNQLLAGLVAVFDAVVAAIELCVNGLRILWDIWKTGAEAVTIYTETLAQVLSDLGHGRFGQVADDAEKGFDRVKTAAISSADDILAAYKRDFDDIKALFSNFGAGYSGTGLFGIGVDTSGGADAAAGAAKPQMKGLGDFGSSRGAGKAGSEMLQQWRDALDQQLIDQQKFFGDSKAAELAYWQDKLAVVNQGAAAVGLTEKEWAQLRIQVERQVYALQKSEAQQWITDYKAGIDQQLEALKESLSQKEISEAEYYAKSKALAQDWANVVAQIYGQTTPQHAAALKQLDALDKQHQAQSTATWKQASQLITSDFDQMLSGILRGTQTFQQAFARLAQNLVLSMLEAVAKIGVNWAIGEAQKLALANTTNAAIVASDATQAAASAASQNAVDVKPSVMKHAGSAAAAVYDEVAQIPYVGWVLAPPAAAAAFASVAAFSAEGGLYEVPGTVLSVLHAQETVMPANVAGPMREFFASGGMAGAAGASADSGAGGGNVNITFAISAIDGQSVANVLKNHKSTIASVVADAIASGNSALKASLAKA